MFYDVNNLLMRREHFFIKQKNSISTVCGRNKNTKFALPLKHFNKTKIGFNRFQL